MERDRASSRVIRVALDGIERLATQNLATGIQVYGEKIIFEKGREYRIWDPFRSKLAAAVIKGLQEIPFKEGDSVLYLGVSTGTTASHISDILNLKGVLFGVEIAPRVAREFFNRCVIHRKNIIPILEDARKFWNYYSIFGKVDLVYCDIAQSDQTDIAIANCKRFLKKGKDLVLIVKSRSIDVTKKPSEVFKEESKKLEKNQFKVEEVIDLEPFDKDHVLIRAKFL